MSFGSKMMLGACRAYIPTTPTIIASGGQESIDVEYQYFFFDTPGSATGPDWDLTVVQGGLVDILAVGCGAGGGGTYGGGGGGGEVDFLYDYELLDNTTYNTEMNPLVGSGLGGPSGVRGENGAQTFFQFKDTGVDILAPIGGTAGGPGGQASQAAMNGSSNPYGGSSGGGGGSTDPYPAGLGGVTSGTGQGYGNDGGDGWDSTGVDTTTANRAGGGGGGATEPGEDAQPGIGGNGGEGLLIPAGWGPVSGLIVASGAGGGVRSTGNPGVGGTGAGRGGDDGTNGQAGEDATGYGCGGGGAGAGNTPGGDGHVGFVIVRARLV